MYRARIERHDAPGNGALLQTSRIDQRRETLGSIEKEIIPMEDDHGELLWPDISPDLTVTVGPQAMPEQLIPDTQEQEDDPVLTESESLDQLAMFELTPPWMAEWKNMPEFVHEDLDPYRSIIVHFESRADLLAFSTLVEQKFTPDTKSIWYPKASILSFSNKRYMDVKS
jgi:hypothetical protein